MENKYRYIMWVWWRQRWARRKAKCMDSPQNNLNLCIKTEPPSRMERTQQHCLAHNPDNRFFSRLVFYAEIQIYTGSMHVLNPLKIGSLTKLLQRTEKSKIWKFEKGTWNEAKYLFQTSSKMQIESPIDQTFLSCPPLLVEDTCSWIFCNNGYYAHLYQ